MEMADVYEIYSRRARKAHKCCACRGTIEPRESYHIHEILYDGRWDRLKVCCDCEAIRNEMNEFNKDDEMEAPDTLYENIFEYGGEFAPRFVAIMTKRGVQVPDWIVRRVQEINNASVEARKHES